LKPGAKRFGLFNRVPQKAVRLFTDDLPASGGSGPEQTVVEQYYNEIKKGCDKYV
jgi:hypothetical protein